MAPLPSAVAEYVGNNHGTTPDDVIDTLGIDESWRPQIAHYLCLVNQVNPAHAHWSSAALAVNRRTDVQYLTKRVR